MRLVASLHTARDGLPRLQLQLTSNDIADERGDRESSRIRVRAHSPRPSWERIVSHVSSQTCDVVRGRRPHCRELSATTRRKQDHSIGDDESCSRNRLVRVGRDEKVELGPVLIQTVGHAQRLRVPEHGDRQVGGILVRVPPGPVDPRLELEKDEASDRREADGDAVVQSDLPRRIKDVLVAEHAQRPIAAHRDDAVRHLHTRTERHEVDEPARDAEPHGSRAPRHTIEPEIED